MYKDGILLKNCYHNLTYDMPRNVAKGLNIAFLQSDLFWQVTYARSKAKAPTEIST